ncbi:hypothetical protein D5086_000787 [Populus alba]|uniref:Uncharacterized protein n=1 Tax=Populus alba TaxID=43335 RepID=A0ACC4CWT9_POPAL
MTSEPRQQEDVGVGSTEQFVIPMEGPASATTQMRDSSSLPEVSISMESGRGSTNGESVILHIRTHSPRRENLPLHEVEIGNFPLSFLKIMASWTGQQFTTANPAINIWTNSP